MTEEEEQEGLEREFRYGDRVEVLDGFFAGQKGTLANIRRGFFTDDYYVELDDAPEGEDWYSYGDLRLLSEAEDVAEPEPEAAKA